MHVHHEYTVSSPTNIGVLHRVSFRETKYNIGMIIRQGFSFKLKPAGAQDPWLKETNSQVLQQSLKDLMGGFQKFFKGLSAFPKKHTTDSFRFPQGFKRECQDFCVWGGYSRGSPTRLPFVFEMQYARPDAIAGAKVEGPARSAGGSSLAPAIARREAAGALAREV